MNLAIEEAKKAIDSDDVPVGAVIVKNNVMIAKGHNLVEERSCCLYHAEILCIEEASRFLNRRLLEDCDLYVTLEPCAMCAGAIAHARIKRLYFGAYDPKGGFIDHNARVFKDTLHKPDVYGGIQEEECAQLLKDFFKNKRL